MKIFIPYRPSRGGLDSVPSNPIQQDDYSFKVSNNSQYRHPDDDIHRCLISLAKNSRYRHEAVVCIDDDLQIQDDWLKHLNLSYNLDITIYRSHVDSIDAHVRLPESLKQAILSLANDNDIVAWDLISDAVVCKNWDVQIINSITQYGDKYYYVPMFVEPRTEEYRSQISDMSLPDTIASVKRCSPQTTHNIWTVWRANICCHSLTMIPKADRPYAIESDFDEYVSIANQFDKDVIIEPAGERTYGYWSPMISSGRILKDLLARMNCISGSDLLLDNSFPMEKMVLCRSYVFHMHYKTILDDIEVEHVK